MVSKCDQIINFKRQLSNPKTSPTKAAEIRRKLEKLEADEQLCSALSGKPKADEKPYSFDELARAGEQCKSEANKPNCIEEQLQKNRKRHSIGELEAELKAAKASGEGSLSTESIPNESDLEPYIRWKSLEDRQDSMPPKPFKTIDAAPTPEKYERFTDIEEKFRPNELEFESEVPKNKEKFRLNPKIKEE